MKKITALVFIGMIASVQLPAAAETVIIPIGQQAEELSNLERPQTGETQAKVRARFGEPLTTKPAVGKPPISSWEYKDFIVYFEHDHVIRTVLKHRPYVD